MQTPLAALTDGGWKPPLRSGVNRSKQPIGRSERGQNTAFREQTAVRPADERPPVTVVELE